MSTYDIYQVEIIEPISGQLRKIYLSNEINIEEINSILITTFNIINNTNCIGLLDEQSIYYPFSYLTKNPKLFHNKTLTLIIKNSPTTSKTNIESSTTSISYENKNELINSNIKETDEDLVITEEIAEKAFNILDKNGDGYVHKDEFIEILTIALEKFFKYHTRYSFAYTCMHPKDLSIAIAKICFDSIEAMNNDDYCLDFEDFCAWYLSSGIHPLRELMIVAIESLSTHYLVLLYDLIDNNAEKSMKREKSRTNLLQSYTYHNENIEIFTSNTRNILKLQHHEFSYLLDLISVSSKGRTTISQDLFTKIFYVYLIQQNNNHHSTLGSTNNQSTNKNNLEYSDYEIAQVLDMIYDILSNDSNEKIQVLELGSLLCIISNSKYLQGLKKVFDLYPDSHTGVVNENILMYHLYQILRVIFYFNPDLYETTSCFPIDLACALSTKVLLFIEKKRKIKNKLTFEEFVETFLHTLLIGLDMLQINSGYFYEYLENLMSYIGRVPTLSNDIDMHDHSNSTMNIKNNIQIQGRSMHEMLSEEGEDIESYPDDSQDYISYDIHNQSNNYDYDAENDDDDEEDDENDDTEAARCAETLENDTETDIDNISDKHSQVLGETNLEDSQVIADFVDYDGDTISVIDARNKLGLIDYTSNDIVNYLLEELTEDSTGLVEQSSYIRGMIKLIGNTYIYASVLERSKIDFILDRLFYTFDPDSTGYCNIVELGIGILLFCGDDQLTRSRIAWNLLEQAQEYEGELDIAAMVRCVSSIIKAQICLNPSLSPMMYMTAVDVRAKLEVSAFFPEEEKQYIDIFRNRDYLIHNFIEMFSCLLYMCENEAMDLELEKYAPPIASKYTYSQPYKPNHVEYDDSLVSDEGDVDINIHTTSTTTTNNNHTNKIYVDSFSSGDEKEDEDGDRNVYLNDQLFPPSAVVFELRAVRTMLGLENYPADELMESLANYCPGGVLSESNWIKWLSYITHQANISEHDLDLAINIGCKIFSAFDLKYKESNEEGLIPYERIAAGISFLCGGSPLEERLMVAFTIMDADCDGYLTCTQFQELIHCALLVTMVCSRMVADKILLMDTTLSELSYAAAREALLSINLNNKDEINFEMLCDIADDFLKLACIF